MVVDHACAAGTHTHAAAIATTIATPARPHTRRTLAVTTASSTPRRREAHSPARPAPIPARAITVPESSRHRPASPSSRIADGGSSKSSLTLLSKIAEPPRHNKTSRFRRGGPWATSRNLHLRRVPSDCRYVASRRSRQPVWSRRPAPPGTVVTQGPTGSTDTIARVNDGRYRTSQEAKRKEQSCAHLQLIFDQANENPDYYNFMADLAWKKATPPISTTTGTWPTRLWTP
jgi:hypothetical protein